VVSFEQRHADAIATALYSVPLGLEYVNLKKRFHEAQTQKNRGQGKRI